MSKKTYVDRIDTGWKKSLSFKYHTPPLNYYLNAKVKKGFHLYFLVVFLPYRLHSFYCWSLLHLKISQDLIIKHNTFPARPPTGLLKRKESQTTLLAIYLLLILCLPFIFFCLLLHFSLMLCSHNWILFLWSREGAGWKAVKSGGAIYHEHQKQEASAGQELGCTHSLVPKATRSTSKAKARPL